MTITFLIGNGFDINIGMATRYKDFYKYYVNLPSKCDLIESLKGKIQNDIETWADLETKLGQYIECLKTVDEFDVIYDDIKDSLSEYLRQEEQKYDYPESERQKLFKSLMYPERYLPRADYAKLSKLRDSSYTNVSIISFNYTESLEKFLGKINTYRNIECVLDGKKFSIPRISHIHGYISERMALGVNDVSQINNETLKSDQDIVTSLVKPEFNKELRHLIDRDCQASIEDATWICLFGLSLGDTDRCWWRTIGQYMINNTYCRLLIFSRDSDFPANRENLRIRRENRIRNEFLRKTNLSKDQCDLIQDRIFIGYNTKLFDIKVAKKAIDQKSIQENQPTKVKTVSTVG